MVVHLFGDQRYAGHEAESLVEILEFEALFEFIVFFLPHHMNWLNK
jgi:hypothetical protein